MKKQRWFLKAWPYPSCLCYPHEKQIIEALPAIVVSIEAATMGKVNRNKLSRMAYDALRRAYGSKHRLGGMRSGNPYLEAAEQGRGGETTPGPVIIERTP